MKNYGDNIYACECAPCGVTFDFRAKEGITEGRCPICSEPTEIGAWWLADDGGYHVSRKVIIMLANDRNAVQKKLFDLEVEIGILKDKLRAKT